MLEQEPDPGPAGAGLLLQPTGMAVLARLGVLDRVRAGADPVRRVHGATAAGRTIMDLRYADLHPDLHALGVHRGLLFGALHDAVAEAGVPVRAGVRVVARRGGVLVDADGGEHGPYDLVVAADGARSALRAARCPAGSASASTAGARCGRSCPTPTGRCSGVLDQVFDGTHRLLGLLPTGVPPHLGTRTVSLFWSVRTDRQAAVRAAGLEALKAEMIALAPHAEPVLAGLESFDALVPAAYRDVRLRRWHADGLAVSATRGTR